jgi:ribosomal protein S18 acetylase RimI-like enzyme
MIIIRETKDAGLISMLNEEVQNLHAQIHPDMFKPYNRAAMTAAISNFLQDESCRAYVAYKDGAPAGYVLFFIREIKENAFHYNLRTLYLDQIAVVSRYRRDGIGKMLMEQAEKLAKELSISKVELDHWSANSVAAEYFRKNGYSLYKERLYKMV